MKELTGPRWITTKGDFKVTDLRKILAEKDPNQMARDAIVKATGPSTLNVVSRSVSLVTNFAQRADLPVGTSLIKMAPAVVEALADLLHQH